MSITPYSTHDDGVDVANTSSWTTVTASALDDIPAGDMVAGDVYHFAAQGQGGNGASGTSPIFNARLMLDGTQYAATGTAETLAYSTFGRTVTAEFWVRVNSVASGIATITTSVLLRISAVAGLGDDDIISSFAFTSTVDNTQAITPDIQLRMSGTGSPNAAIHVDFFSVDGEKLEASAWDEVVAKFAALDSTDLAEAVTRAAADSSESSTRASADNALDARLDVIEAAVAVFVTTGAPSSGTGKNGDLAFDLTAGKVYKKTSGSWGTGTQMFGVKRTWNGTSWDSTPIMQTFIVNDGDPDPIATGVASGNDLVLDWEQ